MNYRKVTFYSSIADVYDKIFPLQPPQIAFVESALDKKHPEILDIGCATGSLAVELAKRHYTVTGIDFDHELLRLAELKAVQEGMDIQFKKMDMRKIPEHFSKNSFDAVLCCGNTLVHLTDISEIRHFLAQTAVILRSGGVLLLQIINYDRILDEGIRGLPAIENEQLRFERYYDYDQESGLIDFRTILTVKDTGQTIENIIPLFPLRKKDLIGMLSPAGFTGIQTFGNFDGQPFLPDSIPLIVKAEV